MAKTKWIVPAVAMLLCAVSLIGAGYAAYSATLTDTETADVNNDYLELELNTTNTATVALNIDWEETIAYENHVFKNVTYETTAQTAIILTFQVDKTGDESESGASSTSGYAVAFDTIKLQDKDKADLTTSGTVASAGVFLYSEGAATGDALTTLEYGKTYCLKVTYTPVTFTYSSDSYTTETAFAAFEAALPQYVYVSLTATATTA